MIGNHPASLTQGRDTMLLFVGVFGAFALLCFGPLLYTWVTTPWAHSWTNPSQSLTGEWVGMAAVSAGNTTKYEPQEGVGNLAIKLNLHLKMFSLSKAVVGEVELCDGNKMAQFKVLSGMLSEEHFSAFTQDQDGGSHKGEVGTLDGTFVPGSLVLRQGNMAAVLRKSSGDDFEQRCSALRQHGPFTAQVPFHSSNRY